MDFPRRGRARNKDVLVPELVLLLVLLLCSSEVQGRNYRS